MAPQWNIGSSPWDTNSLKRTLRSRKAGGINRRLLDRMRNEMHEILRRHRSDRHQAAEIHQERTVALQHDHALVRLAERQAQAVRDIEPHGADRRVIEYARLDRHPIDRRAVGRNDSFIGDVPGEHAKAFVTLHHDGLLPTRNATARDWR